MTRLDPLAVADAIAAVRDRIQRVAGDRPVCLVAVTKGFGSDAISAAIDGGCDAIGENYAQELRAKLSALGARPAADVHFIGQLQTNKVRLIASLVDVCQTLDRDSVVDEVARRMPGSRVFVQVNTTGETGKGGCPPIATSSLVQRCNLAGLDVRGLMTVGPTAGDHQASWTAFGLLRRLADDNDLAGCSMGMSGDLEWALECGATHVRIGSALFGERPNPRAPIG